MQFCKLISTDLFRAVFLVVIPFVCSIHASEAIDSADSHFPAPTNSDSTSPVVSSTFDPVAPAAFDSLVAMLAKQGVVLDRATVAAMGFSRSEETDSTKTLVVITLDKAGQPHRATHVVPAFRFHGVVPVADNEARHAPATKVPKLRQDGRVYFMINTAIKSLWVYPAGLSWAIPGINGQVETGVSLLALGASLYGSYAYTHNMELGWGKVEMMNYGGDLGVAYPLLLAAFCETSGGFTDGNVLRGWGQMIGFPLGIVGGSITHFAGNFDYGNASIMTSESKFGFLYGFMIPLYFSDFGSQEYLSLSTGLSMALIPAGFWAGKLLVGDSHVSSGRSVFVSTSAIMGAITGALLPTFWRENRREMYATTTLLGHMAGTLYGFNYMGDRSYTFGQGMFTVASAAVGAAVTDAIPLIARSNDDIVYKSAFFVGSWGGLMLGELLARTMFDKSDLDNASGASISFPGLWEAPLVWACSKNGSKGLATGNVPIVAVTF